MNKYKAAVVFLVLCACWIALAPLLAAGLKVERPLKKADVIVIMSGASAYRERAREAAQAFKVGVADKILLTNDGLQSGWSEEEQRNPHFVELTFKSLVDQGVPAGAIELLPTQVNDTKDEAELVVNEVALRGLNSILIVTSDYHSRRSLCAFQKAKVGIDRITVGIRPVTAASPGNWWLNFEGWENVSLEYIKLAICKLSFQ